MDAKHSTTQPQSQFEHEYGLSELLQMRTEIRRSIPILSKYCLFFSSKWSAELLFSINKQIKFKRENGQKNENNKENLSSTKSPQLVDYQ